MTIPDRNHPFWRVTQRTITLLALVVVALHLWRHQGPSDATELIGGALLVKLAGELLQGAGASGKLPRLESSNNSAGACSMGLSKAQWFAIAQTFVPQILQFTPLAPVSGIIRDGIMEAEQLPGATGAAKLSHAYYFTMKAVEATNTLKGKQAIDPAVVSRAFSTGVSTAVDIVNLIAKRHGDELPAEHMAQLAASGVVLPAAEGAVQAASPSPVATGLSSGSTMPGESASTQVTTATSSTGGSGSESGASESLSDPARD